MRSPNGRVTLTALVVATALTITACSSSVQPDASIGQLRAIDQGYAITVPALWAAAQSDGSLIGGIEPAEVKVTENGDGQFSVDLADIQTQGAGAQWTAATSQAAAVGTLMSGVDPATVDLGFTVTGSIDGPSAGGLLTIGVLADINGDALLPGVTMTGTISPDGSIGVVGYVPTKLAAAAAAGFTTAVIPAGLGQYTTTDGTSMSLAEYGKSQGIEVKEVRTVAEAYLALTGKPYAQMPNSPVVPSLSSSTAIIATTQAMQRTLTAAYKAAPTGTDPEALALARTAISAMGTAISSQQWSRAYGVGAFAFLRLARATGAATVAQQLKQGGLAKTEQELRVAIQSALREATSARDTAIKNSKLTVEQTLALPGALGWATFAMASYQGLLLELDKPNDSNALTIAGRVLNEERAGVQTMLPDALAVLNAQPSRTPISSSKATQFLNGYTKLLNNAGTANLNYYEVLSGSKIAVDGKVGDDGFTGASVALKKDADSEKSATSLIEALRYSANSLTYFVISSGVLAGSQAYGLDAGSDDLRTSATPEALDAAVASGTVTIEAYSQKLRAANLTVGYPLWSSRWGKAAADEYRKSTLATEAGWIGLNEIWYDAVSMFMMNAFGKRT